METRILVLPDGRAVVVRTPLFRSARFASLDDARAWTAGQHAAMVPLLVAGAASAVAKWLLSDGWFLAVFAVILAVGTVASVVEGRRARRDTPEPEWLSWELSVQLDDRPHPPLRALQDLALAGGSALLLALVVVLIEDDHGSRLREGGLLLQGFTVVFGLALVLGMFVGVGSAIQRVRFSFARMAARQPQGSEPGRDR